MPLPVPFAIIAGVTAYVSAHAGVWGVGRLIKHGGDPEATLNQLGDDVANVKTYGTALKDVLAGLAMARSFQDLINGVHNLAHVIDVVPLETRAGLNKTVGFDRKIEWALQIAYRNTGQAMLRRRRQWQKDESLEAYLLRLYTGLFLVGRSGNQLTHKRQVRVLGELVGTHAELERPEDAETLRILQTFLPQKALALEHALTQVSEVKQLGDMAEPGMTAVYICYGLGGNTVPTADRPLMEDVLLRFPATTSS